jgi:hypothetical protein
MKKLFLSLIVVSLLFAATDVQAGSLETVTLVDGQTLQAEVLFEHPNVPRLVLRSGGNRILQSLPTALIQSAGGKSYSAARALTEEEQDTLKQNGLWGDVATEKQIGKYAEESWDSQPVLVWANPGESGVAFEGANWLDETGQPYPENPWKDKQGNPTDQDGGFDGDVLLPGADQEYKVLQPGDRDHLNAFHLRHLTVEKHAAYNVAYRLRGNLWMKQGASIGSKTQVGAFDSRDSDKHTFLRFSNDDVNPKGIPEGDPLWPYVPNVSHWVRVNTGENGSLEVIGKSGAASDRTSIQSGTLVVSEDSFFGNGPRGAFYIQEEAAVILLDGARIGCPDRKKGGSGGKSIGTYGVAGTLLFGTPEHPLTRDLPFGACVYEEDKIVPNAKASDRTSGAAFVLAPTGKMVVHSKDPQTTRVLFQPRPKNMPVGQYVVPKEAKKFIRRVGKITFSPKPEIWEVEGMPQATGAVFLGETDFNGVLFDGFYEGGIIVEESKRRKWQNVFFGDNNLAQGEAIFREP